MSVFTKIHPGLDNEILHRDGRQVKILHVTLEFQVGVEGPELLLAFLLMLTQRSPVAADDGSGGCVLVAHAEA